MRRREGRRMRRRRAGKPQCPVRRRQAVSGIMYGLPYVKIDVGLETSVFVTKSVVFLSVPRSLTVCKCG